MDLGAGSNTSKFGWAKAGRSFGRQSSMKWRHLQVYRTFQTGRNLARPHGSAASSGKRQGGSCTGPNHLSPGTSSCPNPHAATAEAIWKGTNILIDLPKAKLEVDCRAENWTKLKSQAMDFPSFPAHIQRWCLCVIQQLILYDAWLLQQVWWLQLVTLSYPEVLSAL